MIERKTRRYGFMAAWTVRAHRKGRGAWLRHPKLCVVMLILWIWVFPLTVTAGSPEWETQPARSAAEEWGIEIVGIRMTSRGHMVDFRYRVVDAAKSAELFSRNTKPYLIDNESGKALAVPRTAKVGPLRSSNEPRDGKVYWMFFGNPGLVKAGSEVTVVIGDFKAENLLVQ
jgi:hypothetical protein